MTETFDPSVLAGLAETFDPSQVVESSDYKRGSFQLRRPGTYNNPSREIHSAEKRDDGTFSVGFKLTGGLADETGKITDTKYPVFAFLSSRPYTPDGGTGSTTSLAEYFKAVGVPTAGVPLGELIPLINDTLNIPADVYVTWRSRDVKQPDGSYLDLKLKAKDFVIGGDRKNPVYADSIEKDGETIKPQLKVSRFVAPR